MTDRQLDCFLSLAETLSFSQTAQKLFLTQPAVSQQIRTLEEALGTPLFVREHGRVSLTTAGIVLRDGAKEYRQFGKALVQRVHRASRAYTEVRDISYMMPLRNMPEILRRYHDLYPEILVRMFSADPFKNQEEFYLRANCLGISLGNPKQDYGAFHFTELYSGDVVCLVRRNSPLAQKKEVGISDLAHIPVFTLTEKMDSPFLHRLIGYLTANHPCEAVTSCENFFEMSSMVYAGFGVGVSPLLQNNVSEELVSLPFEYPEPYRIGCFTRNDCPEDLKVFCQIAKDICGADTIPPLQF